MIASVSRTRSAALLLFAATGLVACSDGNGGGAEGDSGASAGVRALATLASRAEAGFAARAEGKFFDTGVAVYCRQGTGFDDGVFRAIAFAPEADAKGYEFCYNVSGDLKKVALSATAARDGKLACIVIDATSGTPVRGAVRDTGPCLP